MLAYLETYNRQNVDAIFQGLLHISLAWIFVTSKLGIFAIKVPFFCHMIQGLCFYYLPNTKSKWNKFKWKILDNSNYDHFHGGGGFSHAYVIMHKYFVKELEM
jgi:hypothetical protein